MDDIDTHLDHADSGRAPGQPITSRILLVEDDPVQAKMQTRALGALGEEWQVVRFGTAAEGLAALEVTAFTVMVVDLILPDMTGLDLVREVRRRGWSVGTVLVTSHGSEEVATDALRLGVADYIRKDEGYLALLAPSVLRIATHQRHRLKQVSMLSRLRAQLAQRSERGLLENFTAPIVHDIKNPLARISLLAEIISRTGKIDPHSGMILREVKAINNLVERLLMFSRQQNEKRSSLDLCAHFTRLLDRETEHLKLQNVRLVWDAPDGPVMVHAASGGIQQLILNLVANATEALVLSRGGGTVTVSLRAIDGRAVLTVTDDGPGIPSEVLGRLFQPFTTHGKGHKGTGLGLSIVADIVHEHGGQVEAGNLAGGGARFTATLPLEDNGLLALVVEDEAELQDLMQSLLGALGIRSECFRDGSEVLHMLPAARWDLVVLDIRTPGIGGLALFRAIRDQRPDLAARTMIVSGCLEDRELQELLDVHPIPCLPKPFSLPQFDDMVRLLLKGRFPAQKEDLGREV